MTSYQQLADAGPTSWRDGEWQTFLWLFREWWSDKPENWTDRRVAALAIGLTDFSADQASGALRRLVNAGAKWPPRLAEIVNAIHVDRAAPSWAEARTLLFERPDGVIHARAQRPDGGFGGQAERRAAKDRAMHERAAGHGEMIQAFVHAFGAERLDNVPPPDAEYGDLEMQRVRELWQEFVDRADARRRDGLPLLTEPLEQRRRELGPVRPDFAAAIGARPGSELSIPNDRSAS